MIRRIKVSESRGGTARRYAAPDWLAKWSGGAGIKTTGFLPASPFQHESSNCLRHLRQILCSSEPDVVTSDPEASDDQRWDHSNQLELADGMIALLKHINSGDTGRNKSRPVAIVNNF